MIDPQKKASESLSHRAHGRIKELIRSLKLVPGSAITETELTAMLGMSRTPVHDALVRLEAEGWVTLLSRQGARINYLSTEDMREIYEIQDCLEGMAIETCAVTRQADEIEQLECVVKRMEESLTAGDASEWLKADSEFHTLLARLSHNKRVQDMLARVSEQSDHVRLLTVRLRAKPLSSTRAHRQVLEAIKAGDAERAQMLHRRHRTQAREELLGILKAVMPPLVLRPMDAEEGGL